MTKVSVILKSHLNHKSNLLAKHSLLEDLALKTKPVKPVAPKPVAKAAKALRPKAIPKPNAAPQLNKPRPVSKPKPIAKNTTGMAVPSTSLPKLKNYNLKQSGSGSRLISTSAIGPKSIGGGAKGNTQLVSTLGNLDQTLWTRSSSFSTYAGGGGNPGNAVAQITMLTELKLSS